MSAGRGIEPFESVSTSLVMPVPRNTPGRATVNRAEGYQDAHEHPATFPDSDGTAVHETPSDYPGEKKGDVLTVEFTVLGIPCLGLNGGGAEGTPLHQDASCAAPAACSSTGTWPAATVREEPRRSPG
jgi:hypothetical protein